MRSGLFEELTPDAVTELLDCVGPGAHSPLLMVELRHLGGALGRDVTDAVGPRDAAYSLLLLGVPAPQVADLVTHAIASTEQRLAPYLSGRTFVNMHGAPTSPDDGARAWRPDVHDRLAAVTRGVDPAGVCRFGHALAVPARL
jgi:hypothetical protein